MPPFPKFSWRSFSQGTSCASSAHDQSESIGKKRDNNLSRPTDCPSTECSHGQCVNDRFRDCEPPENPVERLVNTTGCQPSCRERVAYRTRICRSVRCSDGWPDPCSKKSQNTRKRSRRIRTLLPAPSRSSKRGGKRQRRASPKTSERPSYKISNQLAAAGFVNELLLYLASAESQARPRRIDKIR